MRGKTRPGGVQLSIPGMPVATYSDTVASCCTVSPGQRVTYLGRISGGPRFGSHGIVKRALQSRALIDLGRSGTWHIPYCFLALTRAA